MDIHQQVKFLQANGLDPDDIPARGSLEVHHNTIRYRTYLRQPDPVDPTGPGLLVDDGTGRCALSTWKETPLLVRPTQ